MRPIVTLLTDFGTADGYVGEMKGVMLTANPEILIVDVSHDVAPQDTEGARLAIARYWRRYPPGTVHAVVVDPGVGTTRAAIAVQSEGRFLVGPDSGILSPALLARSARTVSIPVSRTASPTFHGRDVFAPAAAALSAGAALESLGPPMAEPIVRRTVEPHRLGDGRIAGEVIHIDRFGNAVTNLLAPHGGKVEVAGRTLDLVRTYADGAPGDYVALIGSTGLVEVARREGNAATGLGLARGTPVVLRGPAT
jgi:S-adenosyl-L-methionine hydrolase (adenosine-forming)